MQLKYSSHLIGKIKSYYWTRCVDSYLLILSCFVLILLSQCSWCFCFLCAFGYINFLFQSKYFFQCLCRVSLVVIHFWYMSLLWTLFLFLSIKTDSFDRCSSLGCTLCTFITYRMLVHPFCLSESVF